MGTRPLNLETLASRMSVTAPPGLPEVAGDPLNVGIVWDAENRLVEVRQGAATLASFVYDGVGRRAQKVTGGISHAYISDRVSVIEERLSTGQTVRYVEGEVLDQHFAKQEGATVSYYVADHLGSVLQETNSAGVVMAARKYDPWGNLLIGTGAAGWAFTGREWDPEVQAYYYRARWYEPRRGRFFSEDARQSSSSLYEYAMNTPTGLIDPSGNVAAPPSLPPASTHTVPPSEVAKRCGAHPAGCTVPDISFDCKCKKGACDKYQATFTLVVKSYDIYVSDQGCPAPGTSIPHEQKHDEINRRNWPRVIKYLEHVESKTFDSLDACKFWCDFAKVHAGSTMKQGQGGPWHWIDRMVITASCWLQ